MGRCRVSRRECRFCLPDFGLSGLLKPFSLSRCFGHCVILLFWGQVRLSPKIWFPDFDVVTFGPGGAFLIFRQT